MTQGYIFLGTDDVNQTTNIECAYALSLSLKLADPDKETCVVVHKFAHVPKKYEDGFDYIIELPFGRSDVNHHNIFIDFWQLYYCTPFYDTMFVNTYSLAIDNIKSLWSATELDELVFANAMDFRGDGTGDVQKFMPQLRNNISYFDTDVVYFRKEHSSSEFFKMADPIFKNWREVYRIVLTEYNVRDFDLTLMINITAHMLGETYNSYEYFDYTDLSLDFLYDPDSEVQSNWLNSLNIWITDELDVKVNNHRQTGIFYYHDPTIMTTDISRKLHARYIAATTKIHP